MNGILITGSRGCIGTALRKMLTIPYDEVDLSIGINHKDVINRTGTLIYLSSWSDQNESRNNPVKYLDNNLTGLAELLRNNFFDRVIFPSSNAVYGNGGLLEPDTVYGVTKLAGEHLVRVYCKNYWVLRLANVFGTNDYRSVFYHLANCKRTGTPFTIYRSLGMVRDYVSVDFVVDTICRILKGEVPVGIHNVGTGCGLDISTILEKICKEYKISYTFVDLPEGITNGHIPTDNLILGEQRDLVEEWGALYLIGPKKGD